MTAWTSVSEFLAMGGHALFVWGAFGMCAAVVALELAWLRAGRARLRAADAEGHADADADAGAGPTVTVTATAAGAQWQP